MKPSFPTPAPYVPPTGRLHDHCRPEDKEKICRDVTPWRLPAYGIASGVGLSGCIVASETPRCDVSTSPFLFLHTVADLHSQP